jgi:mono/diheme cytochrome c family protein
VGLANGPDGCLYIADMYCGIVQEAQWLKPGDYLWRVIKRHALDKVNGRGRVWRLVHRDFAPGPQPHMLEEGAEQLATHLEHPNGWWRDTAQKLLVLRGERPVIASLRRMAVESQSRLGRIHALWTLEGLEALDAGLLKSLYRDPDAQVRVAAIRASESLLKKGDSALVAEVQALAQDPDPKVVLQTLLTATLLKWPGYSSFTEKTLAVTQSKGVRDLGMIALNEPASFDGLGFRNNEVYMLKRGATIYRELCFACHGFDGKGMPMGGTHRTLAPPLAGARDVLDSPSLVPLVLLKGLAGPVAGQTYDAQMISMAANDDIWIAAIASYVRNSFGNHGSIVTFADVANLRAQTKDRAAPFTSEELRALVPAKLAGRERWKATASRNGSLAGLAIDGDPNTRWTSTAALREGDWFQIELPEPATLSGLRLENSSAPGEYPFGFDVFLSADGQNWGQPVATGHGTIGIAEAYFPPAPAKFLRVTINRTGKGDPWSIGEFQILTPPAR